MRVGSFSVMVPQGKERSSDGYVEMVHGRVYSLRLCNHYSARCDAVVSMDGKMVGAFRIDSRQDIVLETSPNDPSKGCFTFYEAASAEGIVAGSDTVSKDDRGLIEVTFKPERSRLRSTMAHVTSGVRTEGLMKGGSTSCDFAGDDEHTVEREQKTSGGIRFGFSAQPKSGITGLSGESKQTFHHVDPLDYDPASEVKITLRLVGFNRDTPRPLVSTTRANPVPAPVG